MPTAQQYRALAESAYVGPGSDQSPPGWTRIDESSVDPGHEGSANGYFGAAFRNDQTGEIVIANRGSRGSMEGVQQDWLGSDVQIAAQGNLGVPDSFNDANQFANKVALANPGVPISYTGHSLGGAHAQVQAATTGGRAVTFGAPGVRFAVTAAQASGASVTNYVIPGDLVGMSGQHIGQTVLVQPTIVTAFKSGVVGAVALALAPVSTPLALLVMAIGLLAANHPLGNYEAALGSAANGAAFGAGKPAARLTDMHVCPMVTGLVPHVGGPVSMPGAPNVLIGGLPAARVGDMAICVGPPDVIVTGAIKVLICGQPAARISDFTAHGGTIATGMPTVLIAS